MPAASETTSEQLLNNPNISPVRSVTMADSTQYERDLRSANKEWRRGKDSSVKWAHGSRYLAGININPYDDAYSRGLTAPDHMFAKCRPNKRPSEANHQPKPSQMPPGRQRSKMHCQTEIEAAALSVELLPPQRGALAAPPADVDVLYSFDRADTPGHKPVTLEVFVKNTTGRDTERLVEREYEVLDANGDAVRGRRARAVLRRRDGPSSSSSKERGGAAAGAAAGADEVEEMREVEGGFELI